MSLSEPHLSHVDIVGLPKAWVLLVVSQSSKVSQLNGLYIQGALEP